MHMKSENNVDPARMAAWAAAFPGLVWTIEVPRSRLEIVKPWRHPDLGENTALLLKDISFRHKRVLDKDHPQLTEFFEAMAAGIPASALFRLAASPNGWLFLQGWPDPENNWFYHGSLQTAPEYLLSGQDPPEFAYWQQCRSVAGCPVLLIEPDGDTVTAWNQEAGNLLGKDSVQPPLSLETLVPRAAAAKAKHAFDAAMAEGIWGGSLTLKLPNGLTVNSEMRLTRISSENGQLVRLSFMSAAGQKRLVASRQRPPADSPAGELVRKVSRAPSLRDALQIMLASHEPHAFDAILYSDIHADKGHVTVYGAGKPCGDMWGQTFAYEGTIAQNIERYGLNYLVVDDTLDSIKSIDWVLFVPRGIRSYFARPFYRHNRLKAVLILCSVRPGGFSLADAERYEVLAPAFSGAVFRAEPKP